ncbi:MAG: hypothetical protein J4473_03615 [Candidatus Aenigmarchaeota archaeon]|nr:hypothetical protein [Candidatus Aenigmarchaeota archaeon]
MIPKDGLSVVVGVLFVVFTTFLLNLGFGYGIELSVLAGLAVGAAAGLLMDKIQGV